MWNVTTLTVESIVKLVYDKEARDEVSGVVGSYEATRQTFEFDTVRAISVLALISLSLGIINLFPFLPLDGGHIFWALAEKVRGRAISFRVMERASIVGFMLVLLLFYVGLSNDIGRLTSGEGFGVRWEWVSRAAFARGPLGRAVEAWLRECGRRTLAWRSGSSENSEGTGMLRRWMVAAATMAVLAVAVRRGVTLPAGPTVTTVAAPTALAFTPTAGC